MRIALALFLSACTAQSACPPADLAPPSREPAYAYVASDWGSSSAIGLLDRDGAVITDAWMDSGSAPPHIVAALSGDVVLGSAPLAPCVLTVIDRYGTDVLTFLDACGDEPLLGQLDVGSSFRANPQDAIALDDRRALVSRHNPNLVPDAAELERGNDLLEIDWRAQRILSRIDLGALDVQSDGEHIYARPQRMVRVSAGSHEAIVVGLARLSWDFKLPGPGAIAIVDPSTLDVRALELAGLVNCGEVDAIPDRTDRALVTCQGDADVDGEARRDGAGLVLLEMASDGTIGVLARWNAVDHADQPIFNTWSVPIGADRTISTAMGDLRASVPDRVAMIAFDGSAPKPLFEADTAFVIGDGAFDPGASVLLLPDSERGTIRRFAMAADGSGSELDPIEAAGCRGLPPREVRRLSP